MICQLEARIDNLEQDLRDDSQQPQASQSTAPTTPPKITLGSDVDDDPPNQPGQEKARNTDTLTTNSLRTPSQRPSFVRDSKRSTVALRSLYSSGNPSFMSLPRPSSIFSDEEFDDYLDRQMLNSPRLSILSESGFSSIYGDLREQTASPQPEPNTSDNSAFVQAGSSSSQGIAQHEARISDWVEESQRFERPKTPVKRTSKPSANDRFSSIGEVLHETPDVVKENSATIISPRSQRSTVSSERRRHEERFQDGQSPTKSLRKSARAHEQLSSSTRSVFGGSRLPPTPDTMSTATIGGNSSTQSVVTEKSIADGARVPANGYASFLQGERPQTSGSKSSYQYSNGVGIDDDTGFETSDEELESTQAERSAVGSRGNEVDCSDAPSFVGGSIKATRLFSGGTVVRPSLTTHTTAVMFNGEGYSPKQPSRTLSYPSPTACSRQPSGQLSPSSKRSSGVPSERTITSPNRSSPGRPRSPASNPTAATTHDSEAQTVTDTKHMHSSSLRLHLPRLSSKQHPTRNQSVTSRLFGRSNSQTTNPILTNQDTTLPRPASRHKRPALPRPSSLYGQPSPSGPLKSILPTAMLTDLQHTVARPGTSDGTNETFTNGRSERQVKNMRRHSAILDDNELQLGNSHGAPPPSSPSNDHSIKDQLKRDSGLKCVVDTESGLPRVSESRQTVGRGEEEGKQGKRNLGRAASARIMESFGRKR